jgi:hypothetical protein
MIDTTKYSIFWIDIYQGGYRRGTTHAFDNTTGLPLCGMDIVGKPLDGGYETIGTLKPECKNCLKQLNKK